MVIDLRGIERNRPFGIVQRTLEPLLAICEYDAETGRKLHLFLTSWLSTWRKPNVTREFLNTTRRACAELLRDWPKLENGKPAFAYAKREVANAAAIVDDLVNADD